MLITDFTTGDTKLQFDTVKRELSIGYDDDPLILTAESTEDLKVFIDKIYKIIALDEK